MYNEYIQSIIDSRGKYSQIVLNSPAGCERHHIIFDCDGGGSDYIDKRGKGCFYRNSTHPNCIYLYPHEHWLAHKYKLEEFPTNKNYIYAMWRLCNSKHGYITSAEEYEYYRNLFIASISGPNHKDVSGENNPMYGKENTGRRGKPA